MLQVVKISWPTGCEFFLQFFSQTFQLLCRLSEELASFVGVLHVYSRVGFF